VALRALPPTKGPKVEVSRGCVIVSSQATVDHRLAMCQLSGRLHLAARAVGLRVYPEINVVHGDELYIPDISVLRRSGAGQTSMDIADAVMLVGIEPGDHVIDRPRVYAEAGVPWFMRVEFRRRVPTVVLQELVEGEYRTVVACAAGSTFAMTEPFPFSVDPGELLDD
jgi:hypothetical protein